MFLKLLISIFIVFTLRMIFPTLIKGIKAMVIILLIAIVFFNIVLNNNTL